LPPYFFINALKLAKRLASSFDMRGDLGRGFVAGAWTGSAAAFEVTRAEVDLVGISNVPIDKVYLKRSFSRIGSISAGVKPPIPFCRFRHD
jgi:hypothetical protein